MSQNVDFDRYLTFVDGVTSEPSRNNDAYVYRIQELVGQGMDVARLQTAADGLTAEGGEFMEIIKKIVFQGKEYNEENIFHMKRELGDIFWYLAQAAISLDVSFAELVEMNVEKLEKRYPGGSFDVHYSENRQAGDL